MTRQRMGGRSCTRIVIHLLEDLSTTPRTSRTPTGSRSNWSRRLPQRPEVQLDRLTGAGFPTQGCPAAAVASEMAAISSEVSTTCAAAALAQT